MRNNLDGAINRKVSLLIKGLVIILPLFFLSSDGISMDNVGKLSLLWLIILPALCAIIIKTIKKECIKPRRLWIDQLIIIYLAIFFLSSLNSMDQFVSFFGLFNNFNLPFFAILAYILLYFAIINYARDKKAVISLLKLSIYAYSVIVFSAILLLLGSWVNIFNDNSLVFLIFSRTTGTLEDFSLYIATMDVIIFSTIISNGLNKLFYTSSRQTNIIKIVLFSSLWLLAIINFIPAWWCLAIGIITAVIIKGWLFHRSKGIKSIGKNRSFLNADQLIKPPVMIILIILPVLFLLINYTILADVGSSRRLRQNLLLDYSNTALVAGKAAANKPVLGYGPEMFSNTISLFRERELNSLPGWDIRYKNGSSFIFVILATTGIIGLIGYLSIIGAWLYYFLSCLCFLKKAGVKDFDGGDINKTTGILIVLASGMVSLFIGQLIYTTNTVLMFLFWLFLALSAAIMRGILKSNNKEPALINKKTKNSTDRKIARTMLLFSVLLLLFFGWVFVAGIYIKYWIADNYYTKAVGATEQEKEKFLITAASLNKYNYLYKLGLAKYYLRVALKGADKAPGGGNLEMIRDNINNSIAWAKAAQAISPRNVAVYEILGVIYRDISRFSPESTTLAINTFKKAAELEPTNPVILTEIGYIYLNRNDGKLAAKFFIKAVGLKNNYYQAELGLAKAFMTLEKYSDALNILRKLEKSHDDISIIYEHGRALYNTGNTEQAIKKFQEVITKNPLHANALFSLGLALERADSPAEALYYYKKVERLNSDNEVIKNKIENLAGQ